MDFFLPIVLVLVFFILFSVCGWCCKRKQQGVVFGQAGNPITVSNQPVNASPVVNPPYPLDAHHPVPQPIAHQPPPPGFAPGMTYQGGYPPAPGGAYPGVYPPPAGGYPSVPYPPQSAPPPYHEVVMQPPPSQPVHEGYVKQAPYNPNF